MPSSSLDTGIFTAIKQPSGNKIMISSSTEKIASISEEDYARLLKNMIHITVLLLYFLLKWRNMKEY